METQRPICSNCRRPLVVCIEEPTLMGFRCREWTCPGCQTVHVRVRPEEDYSTVPIRVYKGH